MKLLRYALLNFGVIWLLLKGRRERNNNYGTGTSRQYKLNDRDLYVYSVTLYRNKGIIFCP